VFTRGLILSLLVAACSDSPTATPSPPLANAASPLPTSAAPGSDAVWVPLTEPFHAIAIRDEGSLRCAISQHGDVACWGTPFPGSAAAVELQVDRGTPKRLDGVRDVSDVAVVRGWICVAQRSGPGGCYRADPEAPEVGPGAWPAPPAELAVQRLGATLCALLRDGRVWCERRPSTITDATRLACEDTSCCAVTPRGLVCFGHHPELAIADEPGLLPDTIDVVDVALERQTICVRTKSGAGRCWGSIAEDTVQRRSITRVAALRGSACMVDTLGALGCSRALESTRTLENIVDADGTCTVHRDGSVWCWGDNEFGQLGDGTPLLAVLPAQVTGLPAVIDARLRQQSTCALLADHSLRCWGDLPPPPATKPVVSFASSRDLMECDIHGPMDSTCTMGAVGPWPLELERGGTVKSLAIDGDGATCRIDVANTVHCAREWKGRWTPSRMRGRVLELVSLYGGFCARFVDGHVECQPKLDAAPVRIPQIRDAVQLAGGFYRGCARTKSGHVWCWTMPDAKPTEIAGARGATWIAGYDAHTCVIVAGEVRCWGLNHDGQHGDGTITPLSHGFASAPQREDATPAKAPFTATRVMVGPATTCAIDDRARLWCWGSDRHGELGRGRVGESKTPSRVVGIGPR
jgi:hypothetical protein